MDTRKQAEHVARKTELAIAMIRKFDEPTIAELLRRGEQSPTPDGFPGGGTSNGSKSSDETTSTEAAALRGLPNDAKEPDDWGKHVILDPIGDLITEITQRLGEVYDIARILDKKRQVVMFAADSKRGREQVTAACRICQTEPAIKGGMDMNCYNDWWKHGSPDRLRWEMWKLGTTKRDADTDGTVLMVPECPPPSAGRVAIRGPWREGAAAADVDTLDTSIMQEV